MKQDNNQSPSTEDIQTILLDLQNDLTVLLEEYGFDGLVSVRSYSDAGILTRDNGVVLEVGDSEFQITIIRSM